MNKTTDFSKVAAATKSIDGQGSQRQLSNDFMSAGAAGAGDRYDDLRKQEKAERRWLNVLEKKHQNTDAKKKHIKELLNRKFKHEKEGEAKLKELRETNVYKAEERAEKFLGNIERKRFEEDKLEKTK